MEKAPGNAASNVWSGERSRAGVKAERTFENREEWRMV
jgi:hypothetical protein